MTLHASKNPLLLCLLLSTSVAFTRLGSREPNPPEITVERVERVSRDEVYFRVKVRNTSDRPIFFTGISDELGQRLDPVYFDQWRAKEGWTANSCMDTPPPHVIKLNPGEAITWAPSGWKLPMVGVCKNRITAWEGKFRFRVEYFESEKQARAYIDKLFSPRWKEARAAGAFSDPFEIPPTPNPEH